MSIDGIAPQLQRWLRFFVGGGINTAFTYGLYLALNALINYQAAYFFAYVAGIAFSYWFNAVVVFHVPLSWKGFLAYPLVYVLQYSFSALMLGGLVEVVRIRESLAPLVVAMIMLPLTYVVSKVVLERTRRGPPDGMTTSRLGGKRNEVDVQ